MSKAIRIGALCALLAGLATGAGADVLELNNGAIVEGFYVGGSQNSIRFEVDGSVEVFSIDEVLAITFTGGGEPAAAPQAAAAPPPASSGAVVVPAGTRIVVRTDQDVDSKRHKAGYKFTTRLEADLVAGGVTVAPKGSTVYAVMAQSKQSGRLAGQSELVITMTDIMISNQMVPIVTSDVQAVSGNTGRQTVGRTARAAAIGGLIDGSSGARTGAKVGLGVSILTSGSTVSIPRGTLLEFRLGQDLRPM